MLRRRGTKSRKSSHLDEQAAGVVLGYLAASGQGETVLDIVTYLRARGCWTDPTPDPAKPTASDEDAVPDDFAWGSALLDLIRSLPPAQAAYIGSIRVSPPWQDATDPIQIEIGKIVNVFEAAEIARSAAAANATGAASAQRSR